MKNCFEFNPLFEETADAWQVLFNYGFEFIYPPLAYVGTFQFIGVQFPIQQVAPMVVYQINAEPFYPRNF